LLERDGQAPAGGRGRGRGHVRRPGAGILPRDRRGAMAIRLDVGAGRDDLCGLVRDPAQHHRRAGARPPARTMTTTAWVLDTVKSRIGVDGPEVTAPVEAGHLRRFRVATSGTKP